VLEAEQRPEEWAKTPTAAETAKHLRATLAVMVVVQEEVQVSQVQAVVAEEPQQ
jgi:hypothetical protein